MNAVVTGASRGIGKYLADQLEAEGWVVARWSRSTGIDIRSGYHDLEALLPNPVHAVVHCAGVLTGRAEHVFAVNAMGTFNILEAVRLLMADQRFGNVIMFSGGGACYGLPGFAAYAASKAAVVRLAETYAMSLKGYGVRVNAVAPGWQDTDMGRHFKVLGGEVRTEGTLLEVWELVRWLLSDESAHVTGRLVHIRDDYRHWPNPLPDDWAKLRRIEPWTSA